MHKSMINIKPYKQYLRILHMYYKVEPQGYNKNEIQE